MAVELMNLESLKSGTGAGWSQWKQMRTPVLESRRTDCNPLSFKAGNFLSRCLTSCFVFRCLFAVTCCEWKQVGVKPGHINLGGFKNAESSRHLHLFQFWWQNYRVLSESLRNKGTARINLWDTSMATTPMGQLIQQKMRGFQMITITGQRK